MKIQNGNIFAGVTGNAIIAHGCNSRGVMGKGIALTIRQMFPRAYADYMNQYRRNGLRVGEVIFSEVGNGLIIANMITQENYWRPGDDNDHVYVDYAGLRECFHILGTKSIMTDKPIHYPLVGAGLGGGSWDIISSIIDQELKDTNHTLWLLK